MSKLIILILVALSITILVARRKPSTTKRVFEQKLIKKCFGDLSLVERLIKLEFDRNPNLSREAAAKDAIESLMRDNR